MPSLEEFNQQPYLNKGLISQNDEGRISKMVASLVMFGPLACLTPHVYIPCADHSYVKTSSPVSCITDSMALCLGLQWGLQVWDEQAVLRSGMRRVRGLFSRVRQHGIPCFCVKQRWLGAGEMAQLGKYLPPKQEDLNLICNSYTSPLSTQNSGWWHVLTVPVLGKWRWKESQTCWPVSRTKSENSRANW